MQEHIARHLRHLWHNPLHLGRTLKRAFTILKEGKLTQVLRPHIPKVLDLLGTQVTPLAPMPKVNSQARVSLIIPNKNAPWMLWKCLRALRRYTDHRNLEIIVVDNDSDSYWLRHVYRLAQRQGSKIIAGGEGFNFSRLVNLGAEASSGDHILIYNNDIFPRKSDWLAHLLTCLEAHPHVVVGALLYYPNHVVQHAGVSARQLETGIAYEHIARYQSQAQFEADLKALFPPSGDVLAYETPAVTGAVILTRKSTWQALNGFDLGYPVNHGDIDFCLRASKLGKVMVCVSTALTHIESASRGYEG